MLETNPVDSSPVLAEAAPAARDLGALYEEHRDLLLHIACRKFRVPEQTGEQVTQNNAQQALVVVRDKREKILYVEGEPRSELTFLRRAIASDSNLQLVTMAVPAQLDSLFARA